MGKLKKIFLLLFTVMLLLMPSCGNSGLETEEQVATVQIIDSIGRVVAVPENVERIAALYSFAGYAVCLLGRGNDLVGVPGGLQRDTLLVDMYPAVSDASVPREGGTINIEELLRIKPDIVIVRKDTVTDEKEAEKLDNTAIPYIVIDFSTMEEQQECLMMIGKAIGREEEAQAYNDYYTDVIGRITSVTDGITEEDKTTLLYAENQATRATHESSIAADWTKAAGVINVSVGEDLQLNGNDYYASIEQILLWNPEVVIVNETAAYKLILGHPQWSAVQAVVDGRVCLLPQGISRWGHPGSVETPLALMWTAKTVYPESFADIDMEEEVKTYYSTFFGLDLSDELISLILEGGNMRDPK